MQQALAARRNAEGVGVEAELEESTITREGESGIADLQARKFRSCKCHTAELLRSDADQTHIPARFDWTVSTRSGSLNCGPLTTCPAAVMMLGARGYRHMVPQSGAGTMVTERRTTCSGEGLAQAGVRGPGVAKV
jgi:hypothetical protein